MSKKEKAEVAKEIANQLLDQSGRNLPPPPPPPSVNISFTGEIQKADFRAGDKVLVRIHTNGDQLNARQMREIERTVSEWIGNPDVQYLIADGGIEIIKVEGEPQGEK